MGNRRENMNVFNIVGWNVSSHHLRLDCSSNLEMMEHLRMSSFFQAGESCHQYNISGHALPRLGFSSFGLAIRVGSVF